MIINKSIILSIPQIFSLFFLTRAQENSKTPKILNHEFDNIGTGSYNFRFETSDGTKREEKADVVHANTEDEHLIIKGSFSYTDNDGKIYKVDYTADDNGFHPEGDHIKVPPFVPWIHHHHHEDEQANSNIFAKNVKPGVSVHPQYIPPSPKSPTLNPFGPKFVKEGSVVATSKTYIPARERPIYNNLDGNKLNFL